MIHLTEILENKSLEELGELNVLTFGDLRVGDKFVFFPSSIHFQENDGSMQSWCLFIKIRDVVE